MKVTVVGGTGFVGNRVLKGLAADGRHVRCIVRGEAAAERVTLLGAEPVRGDVMDSDSLVEAMRGSNAAINLVGIIKEYPAKGITFEKLHHTAAKIFADAALKAGVGKIVHMSALGTRPDASAPYHKTKYLGECEVKKAGITYTIFRPSAQIGEEGEFTKMMMNMVSKAPILPVFGTGKYKMQPMDIDDTAALFSAAVDNKASDNNIYEVGGPEMFDYVEMLDRLMKVLGKKRPKIFVPAPLSNFLVSAMQILPDPPITRNQYQMLLEDNVCDNAVVLKDFPGIELHSITPVLERAAKLLGK